ncbi:MAG: HD domain-containing protein [Lachnospiraceae bacterium]|nr:HD domain-containing protein [Lachnospiraceae bacterium]
MRSLRFKMTFFIVLVVLISSGVLSTIGYHRARETMSSQLEDSYEVAAEKYANELTAWLNSRAAIIEALSVELSINELYQEDYNTLHRYLADNLRDLNKFGYIYDVYFTYPDNNMVCASDFIPDGTIDFVKERNWFYEAAETRMLVYSSPYKDSDSGKSIITISKAIYKNGELKGVLAADVFVDILIDIVNGADVKTDGYAFLIDQNLGMVVHPYEAYAYDDTPIGIMNIPNPIYGDIIKSIRSESRDTIYVKDYDGVTRGIAISKMPSIGWYVGIATDRDELMRSLGGLMRAFMIAALVAVVIGIGIAVFLAYALNKLNIQEKEQENLQRMQQINMNVTRSLAATIDAKDHYTSGHSQRVADYAVEIAKRMGKSEEEQQVIYYAGILHDIGKICVSEEVINKPGKLTEQEFDQIRVHPTSGYHILRDINDDERVKFAAKYHHERYDGKGYPNGLIGRDIPEIASIIAVADAYDAMASDRSYRKVLPQEVVREELIKGKGTQFDPKIADIMLEIMGEDATYEYRQRKAKANNVLVIATNRECLSVLKDISDNAGDINVIEAPTAREGLEILAKTDIMLVITDISLADSDAFELCGKIKEKRNIPVIILTEYKGTEILDKIKEYAFDDYLSKPINEAIAKQAIRDVLRRYS